MKLIKVLLLGLIITACTSTQEDADKMSRDQERMSRAPIIYRSYIEEGAEGYLEEERDEEEDKVFYRNYMGGE